MPLVRRPYLQEDTFQSYKPGGTGGESYSSSYGMNSPGEQSPRSPFGFVNTDRLLSTNKDVLDKAKQEIESVGGDINSTGSKFIDDLKKFDKGHPVELTGDVREPGSLDSKSILDYAKSNPDLLRRYYASKAEAGPQASYDEKLFDPVYKKITDLSINSTSNPFNYGLLKTSKALEDNTFQNYLDNISGKRNELQLETNKTNDARQQQAKKLTEDYQGKWKNNFKSVIDDVLPQLQNKLPFGPLTVGGKDYTSILGGTEDERSGVVAGLKNLAGILGMDPNNITSANIDYDYYEKLKKHQTRPDPNASRPIEPGDEPHYRAPANAEIHSHVNRQEDAARQDYSRSDLIGSQSYGAAGLNDISNGYGRQWENDPKTNKDISDIFKSVFNY